MQSGTQGTAARRESEYNNNKHGSISSTLFVVCPPYHLFCGSYGKPAMPHPRTCHASPKDETTSNVTHSQLVQQKVWDALHGV